MSDGNGVNDESDPESNGVGREAQSSVTNGCHVTSAIVHDNDDDDDVDDDDDDDDGGDDGKPGTGEVKVSRGNLTNGNADG